MKARGRRSTAGFTGLIAALALLSLLGAPERVQAQQPAAGASVQSEATDRVKVAQGNSAVLTFPTSLQRVSVGNPELADAVVVSAREVVVNGKERGTTTLLAWDDNGTRHLFRVEVTVDAPSLQESLSRHFPDQGLTVSGTPTSVILGGEVRDGRVAEKALAMASQMADVEVVDNMTVPDPGQVLLKVRFAEVSRAAMQDLGSSLIHMDPAAPRSGDEAAVTPGTFSGEFPGDGPTQTFSDAVNVFLFHQGADVGAFIRALKTRNQFQSLAEPNLLVMPGDSASFLAGGEFPFPVVQGGGQSNAVTVEFREFGVRLNFRPVITNSGAIRLKVAPEVSQLDFSQGLQIAGFQVPAILSRRAETVIELEEDQTFAIAGLIDNSMRKTVNKVPILGDIPILGALFRSEETEQNRSELLVLVTPHLVQPQDERPPVPSGEPDTWDWDESLEDFPADLRGDEAGSAGSESSGG